MLRERTGCCEKGQGAERKDRVLRERENGAEREDRVLRERKGC